MITLKQGVSDTFAVAYPVTTDYDFQLGKQITLVFARFNADDTEYTEIGTISKIDCFNKILWVNANVSIDTGEYRVRIQFDNISEFGEEFGDEFQEGSNITVVTDNININRSGEVTEDNKGVGIWLD